MLETQQVYSERNALAVALAKTVLANGGKAGTGVDVSGWVVLYVDTPAGQVSWHFWEHDHHLLEGVPKYEGEWDGKFTARDPEWCKGF
jgi:hypothetical protein